MKTKKRKYFTIRLSMLVFIAAVISLTACFSRTPPTDDAAESEQPLASECMTEETSEKISVSDGEKIKEEPLEEVQVESQAEEILSSMSLEEKIYQMFIVAPEQLTGANPVTAAGEVTKHKLMEYPVGGLIYFEANIVSPEQIKEMLDSTQSYAYEIEGLPLFLCVDEEGGRVAKIGNNTAFSVRRVPAMQEITGERDAYEAGAAIGGYLSQFGFNVDFAPVADVLTNSGNTVIGDRSFGNDPDAVTRLAASFSAGLHSENILSAFKHFPGHGATEADTHEGFAYTDKTYEELLEAELKPFAAAEENNVDFVMAAHISVPEVTGDNTPCSLSHKMITEILRDELGYQGLVITDALQMGAITQSYTPQEAAVLSIQAGVDLLLMPQDLPAAFQGVLEAVEAGKITEERIDESVRRIIRTKCKNLG